MSNSFVTSASIAAAATVALLDTPTLLRSSYRNASADVAATSGGVVKIRKPITTTTGKFTGAGTYQSQDVTQDFATVTCNETFYQRLLLTPAEMALSIGDFTSTILQPALATMAGDIESYLLQKLALEAGTKDYVAVSDWASVLTKVKTLNKSKLQGTARAAYIGPETLAKLMSIDQFANASVRGDATSVQTGVVGTVNGVNWQWTNRVCSPVAVAGTIKASAIAAEGAKSLALKGITGDVINAGSYVTIGTAKYMVLADAAVTSGAATVTLDKGLAAAVAADDAVTVTAKNLNVLVGDPSCLAVVMAPLAPLAGCDSSVHAVEGLNLRVTLGADLSTMSTVCTIDCILGASVIVPEGVVAFVE